MSTRTPYLSTLVLLAAASPAQLFRIGVMLTAERRPSASKLRHLVGQLWLPAAFLLVAALVWYVAPTSALAQLPPHWSWYTVAVVAGLAAPTLEIAVGAVPALWRGRRPTRVRLTERWSGISVLAVVGTALVALAEEVIFRGVGLHLLVTTLTWPAAAAVAVTAVVYGLNHLYFGPMTVVQKTATGAMFGVLFLASGNSVWVPVIAHVVQNVLVLVLLPRWRVGR